MDKYILFVWGIYKRHDSYTSVGYKLLYSECIINLSIASKRANELLSEYSKDKSIYCDFEVVIKGYDGIEYGRL